MCVYSSFFTNFVSFNYFLYANRTESPSARGINPLEVWNIVCIIFVVAALSEYIVVLFGLRYEKVWKKLFVERRKKKYMKEGDECQTDAKENNKVAKDGKVERLFSTRSYTISTNKDLVLRSASAPRIQQVR